MTSRTYLYFSLLVAMTVLSGCASTKYACKVPNGVSCKGVTEIYEMSVSGELKETKAVKADSTAEDEDEEDWWTGDDGDAKKMSSTSQNGAFKSRPADNNGYPSSNPYLYTSNNSGKGLNGAPGASAKNPVFLKPKVLRVWIKPWEDAEGDFHDQGYVYTVVEGGRWMLKQNRRVKEKDLFRISKALGGGN